MISLSVGETELPSPSPGELAQALGTLSLRDARQFLSTFAARAAGEWSLPRETTDRLGALHELAGVDDAAELALRVESLRDLFERTKDTLGASGYARYQAA